MSYPFAARIQKVSSSAVRDLLSITQNRDIVSFAGGLPDEATFPVEELGLAYEQAFRAGGKSLQYGETQGNRSLRKLIEERLKDKGIEATAEQILITTGSQQALDLFAKVLISPGDTVLIESPAYLAALQVFQMYEANLVAVESDQDGMLPDELERSILAHRPKFIYVIPTYSNPQGKMWSRERREALLQLAKKYQVLILEDDPYVELRYTDDQQPPIAAMEKAGERVVYTSTFSKTVAPGIRIGWMTGPVEVIRKLTLAKQTADLHSSSIDQQALFYFLEHFPLQEHVDKMRGVYKRRMHTMQECLRKDPSMFRWEEAKGGMFLWVTINRPIDTTELLKTALEKGVAFVPGAPFYVGEPECNTMRLNFTHSSEETIRRGINRLHAAIESLTESMVRLR
ncbi:MAG: PLP-dependent aminotransferase family protein [Clostridia bacterium]